MNKDLQEKGRAMLEDSGLGEELWAKAMVTTNYTYNRLPSRVHWKTPWEKFFGEKPDMNHMRVFGARAYMHIPKENRKKMQSVSERGVFVGYEPDVSHMRVFGARAYMHIPKENRKKRQSVSERGVFMGYELNCKAYMVLRERDGRILVSSLTKSLPLGPLS